LKGDGLFGRQRAVGGSAGPGENGCVGDEGDEACGSQLLADVLGVFDALDKCGGLLLG
jgi:hypothetical protein